MAWYCSPAFLGHGRCLLGTTWRRDSSTYTHLLEQLKARRIPLYYDFLSPERSHRLSASLADHLASTSNASASLFSSKPSILPPAHHFLYCEPTNPASALLPDGTNPEHFPGPPFHRRLWAGGSIKYNSRRPFCLDGRPLVCLETIRDVQLLGLPGQERVLLDIERRMDYLDDKEVQALYSGDSVTGARAATVQDDIRGRLWRDDAADFGPCSVLERRKMVFLQHRNSPDLAAKSIRPLGKPDVFTRKMTPDKHLLFRYSALTFNAHAIHLDSEYARSVEHHRGLLVHGSLSLSCLVLMLESTLRAQGSNERVTSVEYKNLAPLYCDEPIKLCGARRTAERGCRYELWAETPSGGLATRAMVRTE